MSAGKETEIPDLENLKIGCWMRTKQVRPDKLDFEYELYISREHDNVVKKDFPYSLT